MVYKYLQATFIAAGLAIAQTCGGKRIVFCICGCSPTTNIDHDLFSLISPGFGCGWILDHRRQFQVLKIDGTHRWVLLTIKVAIVQE